MKSGGHQGPRPRPPQSKKNKKIEMRKVPKSEININFNKTVNYSTLHDLNNKEINIKLSKSFQDTPSRDFRNLFLEKCEQCSLICDFSSSQFDQKSKSTKTQLLKHLASGFMLPHLIRTLTPELMTTFYEMLSINLFRPLPKMIRFAVIETLDVLYDSSWPHLSLAYDCLKSSLNCQYAQNITPDFIYHLIGNSVSPDERERAAVRDILHSMYTKFMNQRTVVRQKIAEQFENGVCSAELLEFFGSVVSGFNSPLNPEHATFFRNFVLPLHTLNEFPFFSSQVKQLIVNYIQKSGFLLEPTLDYLLTHWPQSHRIKQGLFLKEIEELLVTYEIHISSQAAVKVFKLIGQTTFNMNSDIAEKAIDILTNPSMTFTLKTHSQVVFPLLIEPLYRSLKEHWDEIIRTNACVTLQTLSEIDKNVFNKFFDLCQNDISQTTNEINKVKTKWTKILEMGKMNNRNIKTFEYSDLDQLD